MRLNIRSITISLLVAMGAGAPFAFAQMSQVGWKCPVDGEHGPCKGAADCDAEWQKHLDKAHARGNVGNGDGVAAAAALAAAIAAEEKFAREQKELGAAAFLNGEAAFAAGKFAAAAKFYLTASRHQPDNVPYKKARARALTAHRQSLGGVIDEVRGADGDQFDGTGVAPKLRALPTVKEPSFADSLAQSFEITVNINDPAHVRVKLAMSQMEDKIKYERFSKLSDGQIPADPVGLEKSVAAFNEVAKAVRPPGAPPVTVEEVETVYNRYQISLKVKK